MAKQVIHRERASDDVDFSSEIPPLLKRIYATRNINSDSEVNRELTSLLPYDGMIGMEKTVDRLVEALQQQQKILIIGDFDADGATSTAVAVRSLRSFGAENVDYLVPNRFAFGYGLTPEIVELASKREPDLIITVDNGISSHDGVDKANELGIDVLVTDHHLPSNEKGLPNAVAIVNPNQFDDEFPSKFLAGVGVIFYVMLAMRSRLKSMNWFELNDIEVPNMAELLDLVALGTVSDVVTLDQNNRILVHQGLRRIRAGYACPGVRALLCVAKRNPDNVVAADLGFAIGPRLNAAGRLDDMSFGISCLLADSGSAAVAMAEQLDSLNKDRKGIENNMNQQAYAFVDEMQLDKQLPLGVCLYDAEWHQGVIGLVASRVKEKLHRPVIAFAKVDDDTIKGSARSIPGFHIRNALEEIAKKHPEMLTKFGGHSMAAGLSLNINHYEMFQTAFAEEVEKHLTEEDCCGKVMTDGSLESADFNLPTAEMLRDAGPWGQGFPEPVFDGMFELVDQRIVGQNHLKLLLKAEGVDVYCDAIAFNVDTDHWPNYNCSKIHVIYKLDINEYRGRRKLQLLITEIL
ncbi:MAG: single-stranded-DNA-specific exonuclease RecJ [Coxiellaceae bacterium]|nr:single-stranded-DNA-specific exonuclease RecJ [Coxiellaceae bacterium]